MTGQVRGNRAAQATATAAVHEYRFARVRRHCCAVAGAGTLASAGGLVARAPDGRVARRRRHGAPPGRLPPDRGGRRRARAGPSPRPVARPPARRRRRTGPRPGPGRSERKYDFGPSRRIIRTDGCFKLNYPFPDHALPAAAALAPRKLLSAPPTLSPRDRRRPVLINRVPKFRPRHVRRFYPTAVFTRCRQIGPIRLIRASKTNVVKTKCSTNSGRERKGSSGALPSSRRSSEIGWWRLFSRRPTVISSGGTARRHDRPPQKYRPVSPPPHTFFDDESK